MTRSVRRFDGSTGSGSVADAEEDSVRHLATVGLLLAVASNLIGCSSGGSFQPTTIGPSVTYDYEGDQIDQAATQAEAYCAGYGMKAVLRMASSRDGKHYAVYDCH